MMPLKMGIMKSPIGKGLWKYIKVNRDDEFIQWFEHQITGRNLLWMKISSREISVKIWTENCENISKKVQKEVSYRTTIKKEH